MKKEIIRLPRLLTRLAMGLALLAGSQYLVTLTRASDTPENTPENRGQFTKSDYRFAIAASQGGAYEVALGNLAQKSADQQVRQFGQKMVEDHGKADKQLADLAVRKSAILPAGISADQQKEVDRLNLLNGADFDRAYAAQMVKAHKADLKAFKRAAEDADDPDLKAFAADLVPVIQDHLSMAESLDGSLKSGVSFNK
jgi:putative membrane protein